MTAGVRKKVIKPDIDPNLGYDPFWDLVADGTALSEAIKSDPIWQEVQNEFPFLNDDGVEAEVARRKRALWDRQQGHEVEPGAQPKKATSVENQARWESRDVAGAIVEHAVHCLLRDKPEKATDLQNYVREELENRLDVSVHLTKLLCEAIMRGQASAKEYLSPN